MLVAPVMPGINDAPEQVEPLLEAAAAAGATGVGETDAPAAAAERRAEPAARLARTTQEALF